MGSAGHKFIAHTKGLSPKVGAATKEHGLPPHPLVARPGQRFWSRTGTRRTAFDVKKVAGERAHGQRESGGPAVAITLARLLDRRADDDQGRWYQFLGYNPRRYRTVAQVVARDDRLAVLCVPDWHPRRGVPLFVSLLPDGAREAGAWLALTCDLSAPSGARLQPARLEAIAAPEPGTVHPPDLDGAAVLAALLA